MAITSARAIVNIKNKHFEHEDARIDKYTLADELPAKLSELGLHPRPIASPPAFTVRKLTPADQEPLLDFLRKTFFRDEPMNQAVQLLETPDSRCIELEEYSVSTLEEKVSVAAVDEQGELVSVVINGIVHRPKPEDSSSDKAADCPNKKFRRILGVLMHLDSEAKIWEKVPADCDRVMEVRIAATSPAARGRGLMRILCEESERIALELGAGAMRMDTTSAYSAAAAERLKYRHVFRALYANIPEAPLPPPPHLEASVYVKDL